MEIWLQDATLVDGTGADPVRTGLLVQDGRVASIGGERPAGIDVLDAQGLVVTPGLIDAHVHVGLSSNLNALVSYGLSPAEVAADMFANLSTTLDGGFTTVRDAGGIDGGVKGVVKSGKVRGPRVLTSGPVQCQRGGHGHFAPTWEPTELFCGHGVPGLMQLALLSDGPETMRANVREAFRRGADFIKMCATGGVISTHDKPGDTQLTIEEMAAGVEEARARGTYVTIHALNNAGIRNGIEAGVECIEHGAEIDEETAALMASRNVAFVPTLSVIEQLTRDPAGAGLDTAYADRAETVWRGMRDAVLIAAEAGLLMGSGSDLVGPHQLTRGRELLLRSELQDPMSALVSATRDNARVLRIADEVGTLEVGKKADLVLWARDPLADPTAFEDRAAVQVVVQAGRIVRDSR